MIKSKNKQSNKKSNKISNKKSNKRKKTNKINKSNKINRNNKINKSNKVNKLKGGNMELFTDNHPEFTISGTGFKDKKTALKTIEIVKNRDVDYQFQVINTMLHRCKSVIKKTNDKTKLKSLKESEKVLEKWVDDFKKDKSSKMKLRKVFSNYLDLDVVNKMEKLAEYYDISKKARGLEKPVKSDNGFLEVYRKVNGNKKALRKYPIRKNLPNGQTWDKHRNNYCMRRMSMVKNNKNMLYHKDGDLAGLPTVLHTNMIMWACSPEPSEIKKIANSKLLKEKLKNKK